MARFISRIYHSKPIYNHKVSWFLLLACFLFTILRLPSLIEPHWYGDEGIYQVVGRAIDSGRLLYKEIWDNKPPVLYLLYALVYGNLFGIKLLSMIYGLLSVIAFFFLSAKIFKQELTRYISTVVYLVLFGLPLLEGNIANAENFMLLPVILAAYFVYSYSEKKGIGMLLTAGLLLSVAFVTKVVAMFDFAAFLIFIWFITIDRGRKTWISYFSFVLVFASLMVGFAFYFLMRGALQDFISSVFFQNISYVGEQNHFIFPLGTLFIKTIVLFLTLIFIFLKRKLISKPALFMYLWLAFSVYNAFFSERPYTHYLLVALPAFALLVGHLFEVKKTRIFDGVMIIVFVFIASNYFQLYKKTGSYYLNYLQFVTSSKSIVDYESFFDNNTPRDYDIANFISANVAAKENIFLLSDNAQIYALSDKLPIGKYIVAYHITFYKNADIITKQQIDEKQPRFIIQTVEDPLLDELLSSYRLQYIMEGAKIYEREI